jgi:hypothetical protein
MPAGEGHLLRTAEPINEHSFNNLGPIVFPPGARLHGRASRQPPQAHKPGSEILLYVLYVGFIWPVQPEKYVRGEPLLSGVDIALDLDAKCDDAKTSQEEF